MASWWILGGRCTAPYAWTASALTGRLATSEPGSNKQDALAGSRPRGVAAASTVTAAPEMGTTSLVTGLVSRSTHQPVAADCTAFRHFCCRHNSAIGLTRLAACTSQHVALSAQSLRPYCDRNSPA